MKASRLVTEKKQYYLILRLIRFIKTHIVYEALTVEEILMLAGEEKQLAGIGLEIWKTNRPFETKLKDFIEQNPDLCIAPEEKQRVKAFLMGLGDSDIRGQTAHCDLYFDEFSTVVKHVEEEYDSKRKLYSSLGVFAGLFIFCLCI